MTSVHGSVMSSAVSAAVSAALALLPLLLGAPQPMTARVVAALAVAAAGTAAVLTGRLRTSACAAILAWVAASLVSATDGPQVGVAVAAGVLLRVWCGLPELTAIGREGLPDLAPELVAGAAATALVVAVADLRAGLPAGLLLAAVAAAAALTALAVRRVRT